MDIFESALEKEITQIISTEKNHYYWKAIFNIGDEIVETLKVLSIDKICNYQDNYADELIIDVAIGAGTYAYHVYPNLDKLEMTIYKLPITEVGDSRNEYGTPESEKYTATVINPQSLVLQSQNVGQISEYQMNLNNIVNIKVQLISKPIEQIRMMTIGCIYRNNTVGEVIRSVLTGQSSSVSADVDSKPQGVNMIDPNNAKVRDHIIIPHGTRVVDVPMYIHKFCGGVYSSGMAYYFHKGYWYVYPPYDVTRFDNAKSTITFIRVPPNKMTGIERTYRTDSGNVIALVTGDSAIFNDSEKKQLNQGNGVRFTDASQIVESPVDVNNNTALYSRGGINNEFITTSRPNGLNNVLLSDSRISANPYLEFSELAARDGALVALSWENSDSSLIYPGMPVKILYLESDEIKQITGIILKAHHYTKTSGKGMMVGRHFTTTNVMVYVKQNLDYGVS